MHKKMKLELQKRRPRRNHFRGFSTLELLIVLAIGTIMTAVALPSFLRAYRHYQLTDAANRVAGVLKYTHFEAIRLNVPVATPLKAIISNTQTQTGVYVFCDSTSSGTVVSTDKQAFFPGDVTLVPSSTPPNTGGLATAVGVTAFTNISSTSGSISFDQRGAVTPVAVSVIYIGNTGIPTLGYQAVVVLPTGSIQIWSCDSGGNWTRVY